MLDVLKAIYLYAREPAYVWTEYTRDGDNVIITATNTKTGEVKKTRVLTL